MTYPKQLIMRNTYGGMIWQAYTIENAEEETILTKNARSNGFMVQSEPVGYTDETSPGWRDDESWKKCLLRYRNPNDPIILKEDKHYTIFSKIKRDGPYWLGGYKDWLICCYSVRSINDLKGFTPIACYSELDGCCKQWLLCRKDGEYYIDRLFGTDGGRGYGLNPIKLDEQLLPSYIFDWVKKYI